MKQNYILRLFLNLFINPRVRVRKSSRLCHELGPVWGRRSTEQGGDWRPFCFFNTAWCCTFLSGYFRHFFNLLTFDLSACGKGKRQTRNWNTEERTKEGRAKEGTAKEGRAKEEGCVPGRENLAEKKTRLWRRWNPLRFLSFVCSYSYVIWYLSFLGPFLSLLLNIHIFF